MNRLNFKRPDNDPIRPDLTDLRELRRWLEGATLTDRGLSWQGSRLSAAFGAWPSEVGEECFDALLSVLSGRRRLLLHDLGLFALNQEAESYQGGLFPLTEEAGAFLYAGRLTARGEVRIKGLRRAWAYRLLAPAAWGAWPDGLVSDAG